MQYLLHPTLPNRHFQDADRTKILSDHFQVQFLHRIHHLAHQGVIKGEAVDVFNGPFYDGGLLQRIGCAELVGIDEAGGAQQGAAEVAHHDNKDIGEAKTVDAAEDGTAGCSGRFAVVVSAKLIAVEAEAPGIAVMTGFGMFFAHFFESRLPIFLGIDRKSVGKKLTAAIAKFAGTGGGKRFVYILHAGKIDDFRKRSYFDLTQNSEMKQSFLMVLMAAILTVSACRQMPEYPIGFIPADPKLDDPAFQLCNEQVFTTYYQSHPRYKEGLKSIREHFQKQLPEFPLRAEINGRITIRFAINCRGKTGRYRIEKVDADYQPAPDLFPEELTQALLRGVKNMDPWQAGKQNGQACDSFSFLTFHIQNGQLKEILP
jgi:hypothetical protein